MNDIQRAIEELRYQEDMRGKGIPYQVDNLVIATAISAMQELKQYRQIGTLGQCDGYKNHSQHISKMCSCNDCGRRRDCKIAPRLGDDCRINCYFWKEENKQMERLTEWTGEEWVPRQGRLNGKIVGNKDCMKRLAAYEDAGYTPEQVRNFDEMYLKKCREVNALRERMRWIPVTERLPKNGTRALVTFEDGFVAATDYYGNGWDLWADSGDVIAWMPLPEPHREEGTP